MSSPYRCEPPFHPDPGQSEDVPSGKLYLVCRRRVKQPGVYSSWPSADAQYKHVPGATVKRYWDLPRIEGCMACPVASSASMIIRPTPTRSASTSLRPALSSPSSPLPPLRRYRIHSPLPATHSIPSLAHPVTHATHPIAPS
ncbi:hypothetical protein B0H14DRAFT_3478740 [Mycena olivaceomarginata]|nr:hypothetical protein B0H14DRAFT_3478740 [Mycena olivaceomarginata]